MALREPFHNAVDSWATDIKAPGDNCLFFSPATTSAQIAARTSGERGLVFFRVLLISVSKAHGYDILKKCDEELKVAVNYV